MTQTRDLINKMAEFFKSEEYCEKGEDARLELSPEDVRCMNRLIHTINLVNSISEKQNKWIPVKWHEITDEEREREGYPKDWACYLDNIMPYDGQRILITTKGGFVELDECYSDDGCTFSLDSGYDWIDDVIAWRELPEPYKPKIPTDSERSEE